MRISRPGIEDQSLIRPVPLGRALTVAMSASLSLTACRQPEAGDERTSVAPAGETIPCAHGAAALAKDCTIERRAGRDGVSVTIRHPDGAFRRLLLTDDSRGVIAADGAEQAAVTIIGNGQIKVDLGGDLYQLPATTGSNRP